MAPRSKKAYEEIPVYVDDYDEYEDVAVYEADPGTTFEIVVRGRASNRQITLTTQTNKLTSKIKYQMPRYRVDVDGPPPPPQMSFTSTANREGHYWHLKTEPVTIQVPNFEFHTVRNALEANNLPLDSKIEYDRVSRRISII